MFRNLFTRPLSVIISTRLFKINQKVFSFNIKNKKTFFKPTNALFSIKFEYKNHFIILYSRENRKKCYNVAGIVNLIFINFQTISIITQLLYFTENAIS